MADEVDRVNLELEREEQRREQERQNKLSTLVPNDVTECRDCGEPIPPERKAFDPSTVVCVDCKELREKRSSQFGR